MSIIPLTSNDGKVSTSPIVNSAMPTTSIPAAAYSDAAYRLPCITVPRSMVGITLDDLATMRVV